MSTLLRKKPPARDIDWENVEGISDILLSTAPESYIQLIDCTIDISPELSCISELKKEILLLNEVLSSSITSQAHKNVVKQRLGYVNDTIKHITSALVKVTSTLEQEYSPFSPNEAWFSGLLDEAYVSCVKEIKKVERAFGTITRTTSQPYSVFSKPIPQQAWEAYKRAKDSKLFDTIVVFSPNSWDFSWVKNELSRSVETLVLTGDPVLVGYIGLQGTPESAWKFDEGEGKKAHALIECPRKRHSSFLIAQWGL